MMKDERVGNAKFHHTSKIRGYVSRKIPRGIIEEYEGRFGKGYKVLRPSWESTRYCFVDYYICK